MYKNFISIGIVIIYINSVVLIGESKRHRRIGSLAVGKKGLRLTRIKIKQSQQIEKVYEIDDSDISEDDIAQLGNKDRSWTPLHKFNSVNKQDLSNQGNVFSANRKPVERKTAPKDQTQSKQPNLFHEINSKLGNKSEIEDENNVKFVKEKLDKDKKIIDLEKKRKSPNINHTKEINNHERIKPFNSSKNNKIAKSRSFSTEPCKTKKNPTHKIFNDAKKKNGLKTVQNISSSHKQNTKKGKSVAKSKNEAKITSGVTEKVKSSKKVFNLSHFNNKSHNKSSGKRKPNVANIKNENMQIKTTGRKSRTSLKTTRKTAQDNIFLKSPEDTHNYYADKNITDIIRNFNSLPFKIQRKVINEVLSQHPNFKRTADKNSNTSENISYMSNTTSVNLPHTSNTTSKLINQELSTTSGSLSHTSNTISKLINEELSTISGNLSYTSSTTSKLINEELSTTPGSTEAYGVTTILSMPYNVRSEDLRAYNTTSSLFETYNNRSNLSEAYSTAPENLLEAYRTLSEDFVSRMSSSLVSPTNPLQVSATEENANQFYNGIRDSSELPNDGKLDPKLMKEFSQIYIMSPSIGDSTNGLDFPSYEDTNIVQTPSTQILSSPIHKKRRKKNKVHLSKNIKDIAGTLNNYFFSLPQNKKRDIQADIPSKVNDFFKKISKSSVGRSAKNLRSNLTPFSITRKPREVDTSSNYEKIRMREFYYNDYDKAPENDVMDTLGDLSEEFAA